MKKHTLVLAILGTLSLPSLVNAAQIYSDDDGTILNLYGNLQFAFSSTEQAGDDGDVDPATQFADNGSTIGFSGEQAISPMFSGYFKYEVEADADEIKNGDGIDTGDQAYFGINSDYGDARVGSWDALIDDWIQDPISNNEFFDVSDSNGAVEGVNGVTSQGDTAGDREGDKFQYVSPSFSGARFALGFQVKGDAEDENTDDSSKLAFFGGAEYSLGPFSAAFVYDSLDNFDGDVTGRQFLNPTGNAAGTFDAGDQFGLTFKYSRDQLNVAVKLEQFTSGDDDFVADESRYAIGARYTYGPGDVYGAYQFVDVGDTQFSDAPQPPANISDESFNEFVFGATYNLTASLYAFAEGALYDREDNLNDGVAFGAAYSF